MENGYNGTLDANMQQVNESKDEKVLEAKFGYREYKVIGIRHFGLFSEYGKIIPQAMQSHFELERTKYPGDSVPRLSYMSQCAAAIISKGIFILGI